MKRKKKGGKSFIFSFLSSLSPLSSLFSLLSSLFSLDAMTNMGKQGVGESGEAIGERRKMFFLFLLSVKSRFGGENHKKSPLERRNLFSKSRNEKR